MTAVVTNDPTQPARQVIPLSARAADKKVRLSVSPTRSVRPMSVHVKEPDGTAWRVITITVDGVVHWYGDRAYPDCRGNCWIDLEVECPHDHPPTEEKPTELHGVIVCEASDLPVSAGDAERDRQWGMHSRKPSALETAFWRDASRRAAHPQVGTKGDVMLLSTLEQRGLAALIDDAIDLLRPEFDGVVGNGRDCRTCSAQGRGMHEPHARDCRGVIVLNDLRAAQLRLKQPRVVDASEDAV